jgi:hypothetical protein
MIRFSLEDKKRQHDEAGRQWYDTKQGIAESLASLPAFLELISERHKAGYERGERMNEFYILGWYNLDTCGNCCKAMGFIPKKAFPNIPDVLNREEFWAFLKANAKDESQLRISFSYSSDLPRANTVCASCGKGWTIENCHDIIHWESTEVIPLTGFVGKTLHAVKQHYYQLSNAVYLAQPELDIRNDRFIDLSPEYPNPKNDYERRAVKNERGWASEKEGIADGYVIQPGDEIFFNVWKYYHRNCNKKNLAREHKKDFMKAFGKAGFQTILMTEVKNEYCSCERCAPWFLVHTELGTFKIGWRKRVINLDWSLVEKTLQERYGCKTNLLALFTDEEVTKDTNFIHAWGLEKAEEYLTRIKRTHEYLLRHPK